MSREISQRELRNNSGRIMKELAQVETFVAMSNGASVVELTPIWRRRFVPAGELVELFRTAPLIDNQRFRTDLDAIAYQ